MEIPENISKLTIDGGSADSLVSKTEEVPAKIDSITDSIRYNVNTSDYMSFEEGRAYFKRDIQSERNVVKNFLSLYGDTLSKAVQQSNITEDYKQTVQKALIANITSIQSSLDAIGSIVDTLNRQKNILDVKRISFIMLGYAIAIIKKIYNC